jgi:hypothetical protein
MFRYGIGDEDRMIDPWAFMVLTFHPVPWMHLTWSRGLDYDT